MKNYKKGSSMTHGKIMVTKANITENNTFASGVFTTLKKEWVQADDAQPQKIKLIFRLQAF